MRDLFDEMKERWPSAIVARSEIHRFSGGMVTAGTMANHDCMGTGPEQRVLLGRRKVAYPVSALVDWLRGRAVVIGRGGKQ